MVMDISLKVRSEVFAAHPRITSTIPNAVLNTLPICQ